MKRSTSNFQGGRHGDRGPWLQGGSVTTGGQNKTGGSLLCGDGNDPPTPPFLPNEAICNVGETASISVGENGLCTLQKKDKWLRFFGNGERKRFLDKAGNPKGSRRTTGLGMTGLGIDRGDLRSDEVRGRETGAQQFWEMNDAARWGCDPGTTWSRLVRLGSAPYLSTGN